jgi:hypothetical protein
VIYLVKKNNNKLNGLKEYNTVMTDYPVLDDMMINFKDYKTYDKQSMMHREIDEYIENNTKEMLRALDELKVSYDDEIKSYDGII